MRQTHRLDEVRAPRAPNDVLGSVEVLAVDQQAQNLAEHYNAVLTQIRRILGTAAWREAPAANLASLGRAQRTASQALATQSQSIAALNRGLESQGTALAAVQAASQTVLQAQGLIASLQRTVANVAATAATQEQLAAIGAQVTQIGGALDGTLAALRTKIGGLEAQSAADQARLAALERSGGGGGVTPTGLQYALTHAYALDQKLTGLQNHRNLIFEAPAAFYVSTLSVFYNGQTLRTGPDGDYVVDNVDSRLSSKTVRLLHPAAAPFASDVMTASYIPV